jgi:hypothetical protein
MERTQLFDLMGELKLNGMKAAFDEIMATAVKCQHETGSAGRIRSGVCPVPKAAWFRLAIQSFPLCNMRQLRVLLLDLSNEHIPPPGYATGSDASRIAGSERGVGGGLIGGENREPTVYEIRCAVCRRGRRRTLIQRYFRGIFLLS